MKRIQNLLTTTTFALAVAGSAMAQDVLDYHWRPDINNHGWQIGSTGPMSTVRPQRFAPTKWVTIKINRVAQIDNLDQGDALGANRADFYAMVWVDGQVYKSSNFSNDDGDPSWTLKVPVVGDSSTVRIRLMDDDGGLEQRDDHVDINAKKDSKDLILQFNGATKQITGDASGAAGSWISSSGGGDDDLGRISFTIM
jgi:hypothetical protein